MASFHSRSDVRVAQRPACAGSALRRAEGAHAIARRWLLLLVGVEDRGDPFGVGPALPKSALRRDEVSRDEVERIVI